MALLSAHAGAFMETHLMAFDVAVKRGKFLLAARAVIRYVCGWVFFFLLEFFFCFLVCSCVLVEFWLICAVVDVFVFV